MNILLWMSALSLYRLDKIMSFFVFRLIFRMSSIDRRTGIQAFRNSFSVEEFRLETRVMIFSLLAQSNLGWAGSILRRLSMIARANRVLPHPGCPLIETAKEYLSSDQNSMISFTTLSSSSCLPYTLQ